MSPVPTSPRACAEFLEQPRAVTREDVADTRLSTSEEQPSGADFVVTLEHERVGSTLKFVPLVQFVRASIPELLEDTVCQLGGVDCVRRLRRTAVCPRACQRGHDRMRHTR